MKSWIKWTGVAALGLVSATTSAADHTDGSASGVDSQPSADITDVFSWHENGNLVLMMNIGGLSGATPSDAVQYAFHVGRSDEVVKGLTAPASSYTDIIAEFDADGKIQVWAGSDAYVAGDASTSIENTAGTLKVHSGLHADPFYFYLSGFSLAIQTAVDNVGALMFDTNGCPTNMTTDFNMVTGACPNGVTVSDLLLGMLNGTYGDTDCAAVMGGAVNNLATVNVSSIVVEVDTSLIGGTGDFMQVWASTHAK